MKEGRGRIRRTRSGGGQEEKKIDEEGGKNIQTIEINKISPHKINNENPHINEEIEGRGKSTLEIKK